MLPLACTLVGTVLGPVFLTLFALWWHTAEHGSPAEFWWAFVTVPAGILYGGLLGWALGDWSKQLLEGPEQRRLSWRFIAAAGAWPWHAALLIPFVLGMGGVWLLIVLIDQLFHPEFPGFLAALGAIWVGLAASVVRLRRR
jgi:hypothetical protein